MATDSRWSAAKKNAHSSRSVVAPSRRHNTKCLRRGPVQSVGFPAHQKMLPKELSQRQFLEAECESGSFPLRSDPGHPERLKPLRSPHYSLALWTTCAGELVRHVQDKRREVCQENQDLEAARLRAAVWSRQGAGWRACLRLLTQMLSCREAQNKGEKSREVAGKGG